MFRNTLFFPIISSLFLCETHIYGDLTVVFRAMTDVPFSFALLFSVSLFFTLFFLPRSISLSTYTLFNVSSHARHLLTCYIPRYIVPFLLVPYYFVSIVRNLRISRGIKRVWHLSGLDFCIHHERTESLWYGR